MGPLKKFSSDPNKLGRGPGMYYHRGNGKYSKYQEHKDAKRKSKVTKTSSRTQKKSFLRNRPHMGDYGSSSGVKINPERIVLKGSF